MLINNIPFKQNDSRNKMIFNLKKFLSLCLISCSYLALSGCASGTQQLIIAPQTTVKFANIYSQINTKLNTSDMRASTHIVQILRNDKAAELTNSATPMSIIVEKSLTDLFSQQGLAITNTDSTSKVDITVFIDAALISVQQSLMKYQANNAIVLRLQIKNSDKILTKTFNIHGKSNGPFNADLAVLERDFNQQLSDLLQQIVGDTEIQSFIAQ